MEEQEVDFSHSGIEEVPHLCYPEATKVNLRRNKIKQLPDTDKLFSLPRLVSLDLYDNLLCKLPERLHDLHQLKWLDLSFNLLDRIPIDCVPPGVQHLYLTANRLTEIPFAALQQLSQLVVLELGANRIQSLRDGRLTLNTLEELWLSGNQISNESVLDFSHLPRLRILSLQGNRLAGPLTVSSDSFALPASIEELHLGENKITEFTVATGQQLPVLPRLKILDLGHNELASVSPSIVANAPLLKDFWVNDNKIVSLEQTLQTVRGIIDLQSFYLARNPCITNLPTYHVKMRLACPTLEELDGLPVG